MRWEAPETTASKRKELTDLLAMLDLAAIDGEVDDRQATAALSRGLTVRGM